MNRIARVGIAVAALALAGGALSGCQYFEVGSARATPSPLEACAMGHTWEADLTSVEENVKVVLAEHGVPVSSVVVEGSQTLDWGEDRSIAITTDYTISVASPAATVTQTVRGESGGRAFFSGDVAVPRDWDASGLRVTSEAINPADGTPVDPAPFEVPSTVVDDVIGLFVTCQPDQLVLDGRGTNELWRFWAPGASPAPTEEPVPEG